MSLIEIASTGARAAKVQLDATAMNTANAYTPGYSRQRVELHALSSSYNNIGNGVEVTGIRRISDQYLVKQLWQASSKLSYYELSQQYISKLEIMMGGEKTGLSSGFDAFFAALNASTTQPDSRALRQQIVNEAQALATRFNNINNNILSQKQAISDQRHASIVSVNTLAGNLATLNDKITRIVATGGNANALRDERDELVKELSRLAEVRVNELADGSYTISLRDGQPLVNGQNAAQLSLQKEMNGDVSLQLSFSGSKFNLDMDMGGQLGALYDYETKTLDTTRETVASIAKEFSDNVNKQFNAGFDLNGNAGKALFSFDISNPDGMLKVNKISAEEVALSSRTGEPGNGDNLKKLINLRNSRMNIAHLGMMNVNDATAALVSNIGIEGRQIKSEAKTAASVLYQAEVQRSSVSGVDADDEAVNLLAYTQAYQANLKVIATGNQIFSDLLALF